MLHDHSIVIQNETAMKAEYWPGQEKGGGGVPCIEVVKLRMAKYMPSMNALSWKHSLAATSFKSVQYCPSQTSMQNSLMCQWLESGTEDLLRYRKNRNATVRKQYSEKGTMSKKFLMKQLSTLWYESVPRYPCACNPIAGYLKWDLQYSCHYYTAHCSFQSSDMRQQSTASINIAASRKGRGRLGELIRKEESKGDQKILATTTRIFFFRHNFQTSVS